MNSSPVDSATLTQDPGHVFPNNTCHLAKNDPLFSDLREWDIHKLTTSQRAKLSFERCTAIGRANALTSTDIDTLSSSFWLSHRDPILAVDGAAATLFTIHYNLALGTLCSYVPFRRDAEFKRLVDKMLKMEVNGQYCLTEVGHGLDAENLETKAVWIPDLQNSTNMIPQSSLKNGHWELHTPRLEAGKYMPPTVPCGTGIPCVAVVFARMIVGDNDNGIWPFLVNVHDGRKMCEGVSARLLPARGGSNPLPHAITYFDHVKLPANALLAYPSQTESMLGSISKPSQSDSKDLRLTESKLLFAQSISRVSVGALALSLITINALKLSATIGWLYSWRRSIGPVAKQIPIISFSTQQNPILTAVAQSYVLDAFHDWAIEWFSQSGSSKVDGNLTLDGLTLRIRHAIASVSKAISMQFSYQATLAISNRCGAQGLFNVNMMSRMQEEMRGLAIAEGDILGVSIRLATELLLNRYSLPPPRDPTSLLARREQGLLNECKEIMASSSHHRSQLTNTYVLPKCQKIVESIGHRMAYDAAVESVKNGRHVGPNGVGGLIPECVIDLFEASIIRLDEGWYIDNIPGFTRRVIENKEIEALQGVMEVAGDLIDRWRLVESGYVKAPIHSEETWGDFVKSLEVFEGQRAKPSKFEKLDEAIVMARL